MQLRNPWGQFEWKGDWSDNSKLWNNNPEIKKKCKFENIDDGMFWIEFKDIVKIFNVIQICKRDQKTNLHININEDKGCCGVLNGCCKGCLSFWCLCQGCRNIYCGHKDVENQKGCCSCLKKNQGQQWSEN